MVRLPARRLSGAIGFPAGSLAATVVTVVAVAAEATGSPQRALIPLATTVAAVGAVSTFRAALATAVVAWALHTGFVLNRYGELGWNADSAWAAALLVAVAAIAFAIAGLVRMKRRYLSEPNIVIPTQRPRRR
jgi:hypothetical protein